MEDKKEKILKMFYIQHLTVKEIALEVGTTSPYITKVIKKDKRYVEEKENRKITSQKRRKISQNKFMKDKRDKKKIEDNYSFVQVQHRQAARELSNSRYLTNENYRKWNNSAYKYNPSKRRYEFDPKLGRSADVPKYIKER